MNTTSQSRQTDLADARTPHLLLVDDENGFRQVMARRLIRKGFDVREAGDGRTCLDLLEHLKIDVVILDVKMPGQSGLDVLRRIKSAFTAMEVILLTGHANFQDGVDGIKSGAFDYLTKPIEMDHLLTKIAQALDKLDREAERSREQAFRAQVEKQMARTERLAALGTLAAGVAHEINNPLAVIHESAGWMTQLLRRKDGIDPELAQKFAKALEKIDGSIARARRITHQMLGFVGRDGGVAGDVDLNPFVWETIELVGMQAAQTQIEITMVADPQAPVLAVDPFQLRQVLVNVLTNAIQATPAKGKIYIQTRIEDAHAIVEIKDTGYGIPETDLEKVFDPFFTTKPAGQGTGLGLFITRGIIEKSGGRIDIKSRAGAGTSVVIHLPLSGPVGMHSQQETVP